MMKARAARLPVGGLDSGEPSGAGGAERPALATRAARPACAARHALPIALVLSISPGTSPSLPLQSQLSILSTPLLVLAARPKASWPGSCLPESSPASQAAGTVKQ